MTREDVDPLSAIVETLVTSVSELYADPAVSRKFVTRWRDIAKKESVPLHAPPAVSRVVKGAEALKLRDCSRFFEVEPDYYDWPLQKRAFRLMAPSTAHLCKSIIFENTRFKDTKDPYNSQYYCVLVQYVDKLNTQKLMNFVRDLSNKNVPKKHYNMRVAAEEKSFELTGFENNAVSPFGMRTKTPLIVTGNIMKLQPPIFYLGAGHVDWKIGLPIVDFVGATGCFVADLE